MEVKQLEWCYYAIHAKTKHDSSMIPYIKYAILNN